MVEAMPEDEAVQARNYITICLSFLRKLIEMQSLGLRVELSLRAGKLRLCHSARRKKEKMMKSTKRTLPLG